MFGGEIQYISPRPGEARNTLADYSDMNKKTGWKARTKIDELIEKMVTNDLDLLNICHYIDYLWEAFGV